MIKDSDISRFISPFHARGMGNVRSGEIGTVNATYTEKCLKIEVNHSTIGKYEIHFLDPKVDLRYSRYDDAKEGLETILKYGGTMFLQDNTVEICRDNWSGYTFIKVNFSSAYVEYEEAPDDGRCKVCGSYGFTLHTFGSVKIKAIGKQDFVTDGEPKLKKANCSMYMSCNECGTPSEYFHNMDKMTFDGKRGSRV